MSISIDWQAASGASACRIQTGDAEWFADVGRNFGGSGAHPDPHDLLDSALGACTVLTLELYAKRRGYALQGVRVEITHTEADGVYRLHKHIQLEGDLDEAAREDLLRVAAKCPIHKALLGQFAIESEPVAS
ncbi:MAG: osmotically inducible protein C [Candidatus Dactylopiibacterium carminicum]|uniref:Osmotically inducible protein C n=1 Tax=Candidatus Dactylopiibacterium carminicum TaxID=857335 RepID=A0A272EVY5_9RHOO|nr:OsmC family protein [Candidatus Dactylopiibacterium carminicum]KAF7599608.1 osmotically inducible protein C [Candidatus Dactylopiibacterium carminicum]PAS94255.1 MAG: osmotically inducible protein C [Candidatus Dactylopiibacterium carminicum]PAS98451.1 MAG: osmotically inducible protein C [Candidatus Dactylopiibacterium carminicum]PAS99611.1 MAG: osmotically inducible protein C [Candidatus Dactylopiibacterium carminicum]